MTDERLSMIPRPGDLLDGRYRMDAVIGAGAMAEVFRATDEQLGRVVAVKVFRPGTTETADANRRESEKKLLASLSHRALVTLFDARTTGQDPPYLVMELVDGGTLADRLRRGRLAPVDAAAIATDLGEALHVVHSAGIVHRDVKPSNVLLRPPLTAGHPVRAVLADFGIAHLIDTTRVTSAGMAVGTTAYMAPEQVRGSEPTPATDIYALGLVLIEMLTGRRAFAQENPQESIVARLHGPPDVPAEFGYSWRSLLTAMTALESQSRPTALDVSVRARTMDIDPAGPPVTVGAAVVAGQPSRAVTDHPLPGHTARRTSEPTTKVLPAAELSAGTATRRLDVGSARPTGRRRFAGIATAVAALGVVAAALFVWVTVVSGPVAPPALQETPAPTSGSSIAPSPDPVVEPADDGGAVIPPADTPTEDPSDPAVDDGEDVDGNNGNGNNGNGNTGNGSGGNGNSGNGNGNSGNGNNGNDKKGNGNG